MQRSYAFEAAYIPPPGKASKERPAFQLDSPDQYDYGLQTKKQWEWETDKRHTNQRMSTACNLCRTRGLRCDRQLPKCTTCWRLNVDCGGYPKDVLEATEDDARQYINVGKRGDPDEAVRLAVQYLTTDASASSHVDTHETTLGHAGHQHTGWKDFFGPPLPSSPPPYQLINDQDFLSSKRVLLKKKQGVTGWTDRHSPASEDTSLGQNRVWNPPSEIMRLRKEREQIRTLTRESSLSGAERKRSVATRTEQNRDEARIARDPFTRSKTAEQKPISKSRGQGQPDLPQEKRRGRAAYTYTAEDENSEASHERRAARALAARAFKQIINRYQPVGRTETDVANDQPSVSQGSERETAVTNNFPNAPFFGTNPLQIEGSRVVSLSGLSANSTDAWSSEDGHNSDTHVGTTHAPDYVNPNEPSATEADGTIAISHQDAGSAHDQQSVSSRSTLKTVRRVKALRSMELPTPSLPEAINTSPIVFERLPSKETNDAFAKILSKRNYSPPFEETTTTSPASPVSRARESALVRRRNESPSLELTRDEPERTRYALQSMHVSAPVNVPDEYQIPTPSMIVSARPEEHDSLARTYAAGAPTRPNPSRGQQTDQRKQRSNRVRKPSASGTRGTNSSVDLESLRNSIRNNQSQRAEKTFACPFTKHNSARYRRVYGTCTFPPGLESKRVIEHLRRTHSAKNKKGCIWCTERWLRLENWAEEFEAHQCAIRDDLDQLIQRPECMSKAQEEAIEVAARAHPGPPSVRWKHLYQLLFPDSSPIPAPCEVKLERLALQSQLTETVYDYYILNEAPQPVQPASPYLSARDLATPMATANNSSTALEYTQTPTSHQDNDYQPPIRAEHADAMLSFSQIPTQIRDEAFEAGQHIAGIHPWGNNFTHNVPPGFAFSDNTALDEMNFDQYCIFPSDAAAPSSALDSPWPWQPLGSMHPSLP